MMELETFIKKCVSAGAREASDEYLGNANILRFDYEALLIEAKTLINNAYLAGFNDGWEKGNHDKQI